MTTKYVAKKDEFNLVALDNSFAIWALGLKPIIAESLIVNAEEEADRLQEAIDTTDCSVNLWDAIKKAYPDDWQRVTEYAIIDDDDDNVEVKYYSFE